LSASLSKRLHKSLVAARRAGTFLVLVGAITTGLIGLLKARAALDARAGFYTAKPAEAHSTSTPASAATMRSIDPKTIVLDTPTGSIPAHPTKPGMTEFHEATGNAGGEQRDKVSAGEADHVGNAHVATVTIHRGRNSVSVYTVPRE
jgi:hypothetical protein